MDFLPLWELAELEGLEWLPQGLAWAERMDHHLGLQWYPPMLWLALPQWQSRLLLLLIRLLLMLLFSTPPFRFLLVVVVLWIWAATAEKHPTLLGVACDQQPLLLIEPLV